MIAAFAVVILIAALVISTFQSALKEWNGQSRRPSISEATSFGATFVSIVCTVCWFGMWSYAPAVRRGEYDKFLLLCFVGILGAIVAFVAGLFLRGSRRTTLICSAIALGVVSLLNAIIAMPVS
jgi:hypothetical protein